MTNPTRRLRAQVVIIALSIILAGCSGAPTHRSSSHSWSESEQPLRAPAQGSANAVAFRALSLVGTPYVYGGESPQTGFDCSGFVRFIYRDALGVVLARTAQAQSAFGSKLRRPQNLRLGDLVFFSEGSSIFHVGLYVGEGRFVHAPRTGKNVQLSSLSSGYWAEHFALARRVL